MVVWHSVGRYVIDALVRYPQLLVQLGIFLALAALIGRSKGVRAALGTLLSLGVLLYLVVSRLASGQDIVTTALLAVLGILVFTLYLVHGVNRKTTAALAGTLASAAIGYALVPYFSTTMHFTGINSKGGYVAQSLFGLNPPQAVPRQRGARRSRRPQRRDGHPSVRGGDTRAREPATDRA